ncbi:MAG: glycosyltransferase family 4 protein, partial [Chloroflexi bacterium]|nr:glycosyltransferase family 4 protein [Chloroflexota bacterium]
MKPTILILEVLPDIKGGQQMLLEFIPALTEYDLHAVVPESGALSEALQALGVTCHQVPMQQYALMHKGARDVFAFASELGRLTRQVAAIARACRAQLLWANSSRAFVWGTLAAMRTGIPSVWYAQNLLVDRKSLWLTRVLAHARAVRTIVGASEPTILQYGQMNKSRVIPVAVDTALYRPSPENRTAIRAALGIPEDRLVVASVGDLIPLKGQSLLLEAARATPAVCYWVIGDARPDQPDSVAYAKDLTARATDNVRFFGRRTDVAELLSAADVLAITSTLETGPRVLAEALACGLPVISTRVGIAPKVIVPNENGYLVESDPGEIAATLTRWAADASARRRMAQAARETAVRELDTHTFRQRILSVVQQNVGQRP